VAYLLISVRSASLGELWLVDHHAIYVRDGNILASAGVTAGIDLALALGAEDHGRKAAVAVARQLVDYLRRQAAAQFSLRGGSLTGRRRGSLASHRSPQQSCN
jgi:transcriptional regulator GlxA family with amidase domain